MLAFIRQYRKRQGACSYISPEMADKAVPNWTDSETRILVEIGVDVQCFFDSFVKVFFPIQSPHFLPNQSGGHLPRCIVQHLTSALHLSSQHCFCLNSLNEDAVRLVPSGRARSRCHDPGSLIEPGGCIPHCRIATPVLHSQGMHFTPLQTIQTETVLTILA